jgi:hypothetical protein
MEAPAKTVARTKRGVAATSEEALSNARTRLRAQPPWLLLGDDG